MGRIYQVLVLSGFLHPRRKEKMKKKYNYQIVGKVMNYQVRVDKRKRGVVCLPEIIYKMFWQWLVSDKGASLPTLVTKRPYKRKQIK